MDHRNNEQIKKEAFTTYEYKDICVEHERVSLYLDAYECFGWEEDSRRERGVGLSKTTLHFRRDRRIANKPELTRLSRHFEACMLEIDSLEDSKITAPRALSLTVGLVGTGLMACSVFAIVGEDPMIFQSVCFAVPAFALCFLSYPLYRRMLARRIKKVEPLIEAKYDEIADICEKGSALL